MSIPFYISAYYIIYYIAHQYVPLFLINILQRACFYDIFNASENSSNNIIRREACRNISSCRGWCCCVNWNSSIRSYALLIHMCVGCVGCAPAYICVYFMVLIYYLQKSYYTESLLY